MGGSPHAKTVQGRGTHRSKIFKPGGCLKALHLLRRPMV